jgi:hypothetical protein
MVEKMAPLVLHGGNPNIKFVPILAGQHSAASLDYNDTDSDSD